MTSTNIAIVAERVKTWFFSDTHGDHERLEVPTGLDCAIFCGDESNSEIPALNEPQARAFFEWYESLDIPVKIYVPGNHSTAVFNGMIQESEYPSLTWLVHSAILINDQKIFGSPHTPMFGGCRAYMKKRNRMKVVWDSVPQCDILVTHGTPKCILDLTRDMNNNDQLVQVGDQSLMNLVHEMKPRIHAFGHVHDSKNCKNAGVFKRGYTTYINCSVNIHQSDNINQGEVIDL
jgi:predicted phosphodiesterase